MKTEITGKAFRPVVITIETPDELAYLWHALNTPINVVKEYAEMEPNTCVPVPDTEGLDMWVEINDVAVATGVRNDD